MKHLVYGATRVRLRLAALFVATAATAVRPLALNALLRFAGGGERETARTGFHWTSAAALASPSFGPVHWGAPTRMMKMCEWPLKEKGACERCWKKNRVIGPKRPRPRPRLLCN